MFYGKGFLKQSNFYMINKLIKKEKFYKALIYVGDDTLKENLCMQEDTMILFCLLRVSESLLIIEDIGYAYLLGLNNKSLVSRMRNRDYANDILYDNFVELKLYFKKLKIMNMIKEFVLNFFKLFVIYIQD